MTELERSKVLLENAEISNNKYLELKMKDEQLRETKEALSRYITALKVVNKSSEQEKSDYQQERLDFISDITTASVARIYPKKEYKIEVVSDFKHRREAYIKVHSKNGKVLSTDLGIGQLAQYLISFSSTTAILEALGGNTLFIDEAFSVCSKDNLPEIAKILNEHAQEGKTIVLISQDPDLYKTIPFRRFNLSDNDGIDKLKIASIDDVESEVYISND